MTKINQVEFLALACTMLRTYRYNTGALRDWSLATRKPAPSQPLAMQMIDFLGCPDRAMPGTGVLPGAYRTLASIQTLFIMSGQPMVNPYMPTFDPVQFWSVVYSVWYDNATEAELATVLTVEDCLASEPEHGNQIYHMARRHNNVTRAASFLAKHGFDQSLLPTDPEAHVWPDQIWALTFQNAMTFGGKDLWEAIVQASDRS